MRYVIALILLAMLAGCTGNIYTIKEPPLEAGERIDGVIVYQPKPLVLVIEYRLAQDKNGNIIGSAYDNPRTCHPVQSFEITSVSDYTKPYVVGYDPAWFESKKFSLELDEGVITKINNESTSISEHVLAAIEGIAVAALDVAVAALDEEAAEPGVDEVKKLPACNVGKIIIGRKDIEDIKIIEP